VARPGDDRLPEQVIASWQNPVTRVDEGVESLSGSHRSSTRLGTGRTSRPAATEVPVVPDSECGGRAARADDPSKFDTTTSATFIARSVTRSLRVPQLHRTRLKGQLGSAWMSLTYREVAEIVRIIDASCCDELILEIGSLNPSIRRCGLAEIGEPTPTPFVAPIVPAGAPAPPLPHPPPHRARWPRRRTGTSPAVPRRSSHP
jgi:hypothetical protein